MDSPPWLVLGDMSFLTGDPGHSSLLPLRDFPLPSFTRRFFFLWCCASVPSPLSSLFSASSEIELSLPPSFPQAKFFHSSGLPSLVSCSPRVTIFSFYNFSRRCFFSFFRFSLLGLNRRPSRMTSFSRPRLRVVSFPRFFPHRVCPALPLPLS